MSNGKTVAVTDATFESEVAGSEILVVADFWAPWCAPCRLVGPILEEIAAENAGKVKVAKINVDENPSLAQRFGIRGIPTMMFFKGGEAIGTIVGAAMKDRIQETIDGLLQ